MISVPQSVLAYYEQPAVQTAVDLLLNAKEPQVPDNLQWHEVGSFYRSSLAARQVQTEYAIFLEALWSAVWVDIPELWRPRPPSKPARPDLAIGIKTVWNEGCFGRRFERQACALELFVGLWSDTGLQLGIVLYGPKGDLLLVDRLLDGWAREGYRAYWTQEKIASLSATIAPSPFAGWTQQAWGAVAEACGAVA
jgi:hypothetical protein